MFGKIWRWGLGVVKFLIHAVTTWVAAVFSFVLKVSKFPEKNIIQFLIEHKINTLTGFMWVMKVGWLVCVAGFQAGFLWFSLFLD